MKSVLKNLKQNRRLSVPAALVTTLVVIVAGIYLLNLGQAADTPTLNELDAGPKPRVVVMTDIGGDVDDQQSLTRYLMHSNLYDTVGIYSTRGKSSGNPAEHHYLLGEYIAAYGQVRDNLSLHRSGYPTQSSLEAVTKQGGGIKMGSDKDTEASNHLVSLLIDDSDPRPLYVVTWGGTRELVQAVWRIEQDHPDELSTAKAKLRVFQVVDQDSTWEVWKWLRDNHPDIWLIHSGHNEADTLAGVRGMYSTLDTSTISEAWMNENIVNNHGPLADIYSGTSTTATRDRTKEGDTPSYLVMTAPGLGLFERPTWGGWSGRYEPVIGNRFHDSSETVDGVSDPRHTVARWRPAFMNDLAVHADWSVMSYAEANHHPQAVVNGSTTTNILSHNPAAGSSLKLSAAGSTDPDGDQLSYKWWVYEEAGTYSGAVSISGSDTQEATVSVPSNADGETIHVILEVMDNGDPALTSYRRVILNVGGSTSNPNNPPTVSLTSPQNGASFESGSNITINASASDSDGTVSRVEFFRDSTKLGEDTTSPYSFTWQNAAEGTYSLTARATDNDGAVTSSTAVTISITGTSTEPDPTSIQRIQYATAAGSPATATFDSRPTEGNLLVAIAFQRTGEDNPTLEGAGWTLREKVIVGPNDDDIRRSMALWDKVAGPNEPLTVTSRWGSRGSSLIVKEFSGVNTFDVSATNHSGSNAVTSLSTGTTATATDSDALVIAAMGARGSSGTNGDSVPTWSNGLGSNIYFYDPGDDRTLQSAYRSYSGSQQWQSTGSWSNSVLASAMVVVYVNSDPYPDPDPKSADLNNDGQVDIFDLSILLSHFGTDDPAADLNNDGTVNIFDLSVLLSNWGS